MKKTNSLKSEKAKCSVLYNGQTENLKLRQLPYYLKYFRSVSYQGVKNGEEIDNWTLKKVTTV